MVLVKIHLAGLMMVVMDVMFMRIIIIMVLTFVGLLQHHMLTMVYQQMKLVVSVVVEVLHLHGHW